MENRNKVYVNKVFECDAETLFAWLTRPELIAQWFGPEGFSTRDVECNPVEGGVYRFALYKQEKYCFAITGSYLKVNKPSFLKFSYAYVDLEARPESTVSFRLEELSADETKLSMVQEFELETPDFSTRTKAWEFMFERLVDMV